MTKHIKLCADDFGYNEFVSLGIIDLVAKQRLSATSCMTNMPNWEQHLPELLKFRAHIEIGLHFNLTEDQYKLKQLILACYFRQIKLSVIEIALQQQLDNFKQCCGFLPDYIDGHQHIQQLPVIRNALVNVIKRNYQDKLPSIRISSGGFIASLKTSPKALLIHLLGANALRKLVHDNNIATNSSFAGFSDFKNDQNFEKEFESYLKLIKHNGLIMCHPGRTNPNNTDVIAASRKKEYDFFISDKFIELLSKHQVSLFKSV